MLSILPYCKIKKIITFGSFLYHVMCIHPFKVLQESESSLLKKKWISEFTNKQIDEIIKQTNK